ncbi:MAG: hydrogenase maturation protease [Candidatus Zixiibacteriota bacterium]
MKILVLGLGNDLLSDDSIGLLVARELSKECSKAVDVIESDLCGLALLDLLVGYERAIIIDAMHTGKHRPGTVVELAPDSFSRIPNPSPHYAGLPELTALAQQLNLKFPAQIKILAVEAGNLHTVGGDLSRPVVRALIEVVSRVKTCLQSWEKDAADA